MARFVEKHSGFFTSVFFKHNKRRRLKTKKTNPNSIAMLQADLMGIAFLLAKLKWQERRASRYLDHIAADVSGVPVTLAKSWYWCLDALIFIKDLTLEILHVFYYIVIIRLIYIVAVVAFYIALFYFVLYLIF